MDPEPCFCCEGAWWLDKLSVSVRIVCSKYNHCKVYLPKAIIKVVYKRNSEIDHYFVRATLR